MSAVRLQSSDNEVFEVDERIAKCFGTIKTMLEDCAMDMDTGTLVPLHNVKSAILRKVIQWADYHKNDPKPAADDENKEEKEDISQWDAEFLRVDQGTLLDIVLAANFLDCRGLLDVACKTVASMIKGKSPDEIRKTFNIKNDFCNNYELQEIVRKENDWCE